ncbi:chemotaxis protein CheW [Lacimicrobium sp. SS2-24]|uniref:chemotaxis protein CheW n=1 Tax=Lacimicrobium sp. SS2-24 TaxID=2005569 RepID=UPI000B4BE59B|nr:chemotaxis protein CheW [Lacimicrobium sp. SS2-24]
MSKGQFANEGVMEAYLDALLTDDPVIEDVQKQSVARLLEQAQHQVEENLNVPEKPVVVPPVAPPEPVVVPETPSQQDIVEKVQQKSADLPTKEEQAEYRQGSFQALFFKVAGLTLAVPLTELGGIHKMEKTSALIGKPDWFTGVMLHRDEKLNVVDTAQWVMPEKYDETLAESLNYQYLIMLGDSGWGLSCESLVNTVKLEQDDVRWREHHGKRPWLAGLVKEKMCALINASQLVNMLEQGLNSNDEDDAREPVL